MAVEGRLPSFGRDEDGRYVLRESWVLFLDVLGASELACSDQAEAHLEKLAAALEGIRPIGDDQLDTPWYLSQWFSDNMVMSSPLWGTGEGESQFGAMCAAAAEIQFRLALDGIFVRGGVTLGPHFQDEHFAFGGALVEAVALEKAAVYPRIMLSERAVAQNRLHLGYYGKHPQGAPQNRTLAVDQNGAVFINYLDTAYNYVESSLRENAEMIEQHRDQVVDALTLHTGNARVWEKFAWVADYHNSFCSLNDMADYPVDAGLTARSMTGFAEA